MTPEVNWVDANTAEVSGVKFLVSENDADYRDSVSDDDRYVMVKEPGYVRRSVERFRELAPRNMVEIGIYQGGSVVFWNLVLQPDIHLAFDLFDRNVEPLHRHVTDSAPRRLAVRYGVDQSDREAVSSLADEVFGQELLDLVIDDGSHSYMETRTALEVLFPRLRPGGLYVIEDWAWAHVDDPLFAKFSLDRPALTNLVVELMLVCGSRTDVVDRLSVETRAATVTRGPEPLDSPFRLVDVYFNRGLPYRAML